MNIEQQTISATDGWELGSTWYEPAQGRGCSIIVNSATAVSRGYYHKYAAYLCEQGYRVVTYDYRGIGDSLGTTPLRRCDGTMHDWGSKDFAGVIDAVSRRYRGDPIAVVGHSAGGQIFGLTPRNEQVRALVLVAVQSGYWRHWPGLKRYGMAMLWYCFMPGLTKLLSYGPMAAFKLGENLPKGVALQWARWGRNPHYIVDAAGQPIRSDFASFKAPVLSYSFADDSLAPKAAVDALMEYYENAPIERRHLQPGDIGSKAIGHFGFFRERYKTPLWESSLSWLNSQLRPEQPAPAVV